MKAMKVSIEYCVEWNYDPQAVSLAEALKSRYGIDVQLIKSGGGVFEIVKDGELIFSKKAVGRFPEHNEIFESIDNSWLLDNNQVETGSNNYNYIRNS